MHFRNHPLHDEFSQNKLKARGGQYDPSDSGDVRADSGPDSFRWWSDAMKARGGQYDPSDSGDVVPDLGPDFSKWSSDVIKEVDFGWALRSPNLVYFAEEALPHQYWLWTTDWDWHKIEKGKKVEAKWLHKGFADYFENINALKYWPLSAHFLSRPRWHPKSTEFIFTHWHLYEYRRQIIVARKDASLDDPTKWVAQPVGGGDIYDVDEAAPCYSPSGDKIAFANWDGIWTMNADGSERRKIREAFHPIELTWSPQGNVIAFIASNDRTKMPDKGDAGYKLYLLSVDTGEVRRVFGPEEGVEYFCPAWNPKGNILAVERGYRHTPVLNGNTLEMTGPARYFIWIVLVNGVETFMPMQVTPDFPPPTVAGIPSNERDGPPTFSADGSKIVFPSTRKPPTGSPYFWWTINIDGSGLKSIEGPSVNTRNYDLVW